MFEINTLLISKWLIERPFIWQMDLLNEKKFLEFAKKRGVDFGWTDSDLERFRKLWKLGIIKADLVKSEQKINEEGLTFLGNDFLGYYLYADERKIPQPHSGYLNILAKEKPPSSKIELFFHPFRLFVLYKIIEIAKLKVSPLTTYSSHEIYKQLLESHFKVFNIYTSQDNFEEKFLFWNHIVSLAVAAEPFTFNQIFGFYRVKYVYPFIKEKKDENLFYESINTHIEDFKGLLQNIEINTLKDIISEICREIDWIEPNSDVLRLIRLTKGSFRLEKLEGNLGLSFNLLMLAETIRRSSELVFDIRIQEEDEVGFGGDSGSFKKYFYGSDRLLENDKSKAEFIRGLGLDYNIRLRWYVEGETEFNALQSELGDDISIEIINLKGEIVAGKGKGLAFRENLLNDINRGVYSWVSLDEDVSENCRVVIKAVEKDEMFGSYFFAKPDFEFKNFTLAELVEIAWEIALENGVNPSEKIKLVESTKSAKNGAEFEGAVRKSLPLLNTFGKGKEWGEKLMKFAKINRNKKEQDGSSKIRQLCESIILAKLAIGSNYHLSRKDCKVDLNSGKLIMNK